MSAKKWFISCIVPGDRLVGIIQLLCKEDEVKKLSEKLAPCRCEFKAYRVTGFDTDIPIGEFINTEKAKAAGY